MLPAQFTALITHKHCVAKHAVVCGMHEFTVTCMVPPHSGHGRAVLRLNPRQLDAMTLEQAMALARSMEGAATEVMKGRMAAVDGSEVHY